MTFSQQVYDTCSSIPPGKVTTYAAIARKLGKPRGARAVGNALNKNPNAPVVPCHRVVGTDRSLTGYALGLEAKEKLLRSEGVKISNGKVDRDCILQSC